MRYIITDLEATCWENSRDFQRMETIEIGAVELTSASGAPEREFNFFIRPVAERELSEFCRRLTTIRQRDVDQADTFDIVFAQFMAWIGDEPFVFCSWGGYDLTQLRIDCARHNLELPKPLERHVNLKKEFARLMSIKSCGMERALAHAGLPLLGTHHRGIDDAHNIARLGALVLPILESNGEIPG